VWSHSACSGRHSAPRAAIHARPSSSVDHRDRDGKRFLLAVANTPREQGLLSLSARERQVLSRVALAHPRKLVAYELGLSPPTVSGHVKSAVRKLGVPNISEAMRLFGDALVSGHRLAIRSR
jgi:DNA-binding CsgD family transcriptional regulator